MPKDQANYRKYYRLKYPKSLMPTIKIGDDEYAVPEISEGGLRIRCDALNAFRVGNRVQGELVFNDGETSEISGRVMRRDRDDVIIAPLEGVSFRCVVNEQRKVLRLTKRDEPLFSWFVRR